MATSYLTPGVYVEEVPSSSATLAAGATAIAAFVGYTETFPADDPSDPQGLRPRLVTSWTQFEDLYGGLTPGAMLPHSVYGWFLNGGSVCYVVRVANTEPAGEPAAKALPAADRALGNPVTIESVEPDANIQVVVTAEEDGEDDDPQREDGARVREEEERKRRVDKEGEHDGNDDPRGVLLRHTVFLFCQWGG